MANSKNEISLKMIECFVKSETQTRADMSDEVGLTPSNVSRSLGKLEELLGVELYEPDGQKRKLTDMGRKLIPYAKDMLALLNHMNAAAEIKQPTLLRVGIAAHGIERPVMDMFLSHYSESELFPDGIDFEVQPLEYLLKCADIDVIISDRRVAFGELETGRNPNTSHGYQVRRDPIPAAFWSTPSERIGPLQFMLEHNMLLLPSFDSPFSQKVRLYCEDQGVRPRYRYFNDLRDMAYAASRGLGLCVARADVDFEAEFGLERFKIEDSIQTERWVLVPNADRMGDIMSFVEDIGPLWDKSIPPYCRDAGDRFRYGQD